MKKTRIDDMEVLILSSKKPKYIEMEDKKEDKKSDIFDYYFPVVQITTTITFIGCWLYAIVCYGFFLGVGLGWFPSLIIAVIVGFLWPLMAILIAIMIILVILVIIFG
jgi:ABC-type multidrug transport system permease subunit